MTAYNFGDVILVPFPFTDLQQSKQRPAVIKPILATLEQRLVRKTLGRLTETDRAALKAALQTVLG